MLLRHLEPDPGEGVGRVHLQVVHGGAAVAGVVGVRHQEGGAAPVQEDDLVEHERGALQQPVLQLPAEQAPALLQDEGSLALLQVQLLQQTLAFSFGGYEDLGLNIKAGSEKREERGERREERLTWGKRAAQEAQPSQCWRLGAMMAETVEPSRAISNMRGPVAWAGLCSTREPSVSLMTVVVVSMSKLSTVLSFTLSM